MAVLRYLQLVHAQARANAAEFARTAPDGTVVTFSEPKRDGAINAALHAKLAHIARTRTWAGAPQTAETWKRLFVAAWLRATGRAVLALPALDGQGVDVVWRHTSSMSQREVSELLSYVEAWEAETEAATA